MRFLNPQQEDTLSALVAEGIVLRANLQEAVGDAAVDLWEALCAHHATAVRDAAWLEWCIRSRLARINGVRMSATFLRDLQLTPAHRSLLKREWCIPFTRNAYGQIMVAVIPGLGRSPAVSGALGENMVPCAANFGEWGALRNAL